MILLIIINFHSLFVWIDPWVDLLLSYDIGSFSQSLRLFTSFLFYGWICDMIGALKPFHDEVLVPCLELAEIELFAFRVLLMLHTFCSFSGKNVFSLTAVAFEWNFGALSNQMVAEVVQVSEWTTRVMTTTFEWALCHGDATLVLQEIWEELQKIQIFGLISNRWDLKLIFHKLLVIRWIWHTLTLESVRVFIYRKELLLIILFQDRSPIHFLVCLFIIQVIHVVFFPQLFQWVFLRYMAWQGHHPYLVVRELLPFEHLFFHSLLNHWARIVVDHYF